MSYIIARKKGRVYEMYVDEDIYGRGHFSHDNKITDQPVFFNNKAEAWSHMNGWITKEDGWEYLVEYYE